MNVIEGCKNIPFEIKRVFYVYDVENSEVRGGHANINSEFVIICLSGQVDIEVDNINQKETYTLNKASTGLYIPRMVWKKMYNFKKDTVLLILSSEYYDENEYINSYLDFKNNIVKK